MTLSDLVYRRALAILWSAGHEPTRAHRLRMQSAAWRHEVAADWPMRDQAVTQAACGLLGTMGYAPDASAPWLEAMPFVGDLLRHAPAPGHVVRIDGEGGWMGVKSGDMLTLSSCGERGRLMIGKGRHHETGTGSVSLSSGGPGSIVGLRTEVLRRTDETVRAWFWRFHMSPEANGGVDYARLVPVWTWDGDASAFDGVAELAA